MDSVQKCRLKTGVNHRKCSLKMKTQANAKNWFEIEAKVQKTFYYSRLPNTTTVYSVEFLKATVFLSFLLFVSSSRIHVTYASIADCDSHFCDCCSVCCLLFFFVIRIVFFRLRFIVVVIVCRRPLQTRSFSKFCARNILTKLKCNWELALFWMGTQLWNHHHRLVSVYQFDCYSLFRYLKSFLFFVCDLNV